MPWARCAARDTPGHSRLVPTCRTVCNTRVNRCRITIDIDLTPEVEITGYQRYQDGHGLEVRWPLPARCRCENCGHDDVAHIEFKTIPQAIRDLNLVLPF